MKKKHRIEEDSLGSIKVDNKKLWGAQTQRSVINFNIGSEKMPDQIIISLGYQKKAAAITNMQMGKLDNKKAKVIIKACDEIINGKLLQHFPLFIWQTGSGTQTNMNANEVISNRSIQMLKGKVGSKNPIHPNDHVNMSQSSNDVFPTIMHITSVLDMKKKLIPSINLLIKTFEKKEKEFKKIIKIGRTHTQDATPLTLGQVFSSYKEQIIKNKNKIMYALDELMFLAQGGTAVGSGLNAPKNFDKKFCENLSKLTKLNFKPAKNKFESIAAHDSLVHLSGCLNNLSVSLLKICNDLRMLSSGPRSGIGELILPVNEPGSSIMPGKVNPTHIEALTMVCVQVMGNHSTVTFAGSQGHFELNTFKPVIIYNILQSINLFSDSINLFSIKCLVKIKANKKNIIKNLRESLMLVTALSPKIGYDNASKIAQKAHKENISLKKACLEMGFLSPKEFDKLVDPKKMI
tara:strand:+ start:855 stop:2240 length:1386 start_codon:yes stop_codon:yes gene_type:complete